MANDVLARLSVLFEANTAKFGAALNLLSNEMNKFGATVKAQENSITRFEKTIAGVQRTLGSLGLAFGAFQIVNVIRGAINSMAQFEKQMDTVAAIAGATGKDFEDLRNDALRLGASTQFTATQVAELQTEFGRLGFSTKEILAATEATLQLSIATGEDLARSADVAGSTVRAFGLNADETQRVVDVMALSFNKSALALDNFSESMKYVAPIAASANISVEETTALLGTLADAGIRGSQAGTSLRRIISDLAKDGRPLAERLKELADKGLTFGGAMDEVGRFAQSALLVLTKNTDKTRDLTLALDDASGSAKRMADIMQDNLTGDTIKLTSAYDGLILSLSGSTGVFRQVVQSLTELLNVINDIINSKFISWYSEILFLGPKIGQSILKTISLLGKSGDEIDVSANKAGLLYYELNRIKNIAELEGRTEDAKEYQEQIDKLTDEFGDLGREVTALGPPLEELNSIFLSTAIQIFGNRVSESSGLIAGLEEKARKLGDAIKNATSISEIRRLQHELEGVKLRIQEILDPNIAPEPIEIPITFGDLTVNTEQLEESLQRIRDLANFTIDPIEVEIDTETIDVGVEETINKLSEGVVRFQEITSQFSTLFRDALQSGIESFAQDIGNAISGVGNFGENLLKAAANFAKQFGALLIAAGLAKIAFENLGISGIGAVLAGAALIAAATAVSNHLSKASSVGRSSSFSGGTSGGSTSTFQTERAGEQIVLGGELTATVRGEDLLISLAKVQTRKEITG